MNEKQCFKCSQVLPLTHFYKHPQMGDGYLNKCKECNKKDSRGDYNRKIVDPEWKLKERERSRAKMSKARKEGKYISIEKEQKKLCTERYENKYPEKKAARSLCQRMKQEPCVVCGSKENIEGHHEDYSKPRDITWLCRNHHYERHVELRKQKLIGK